MSELLLMLMYPVAVHPLLAVLKPAL